MYYIMLMYVFVGSDDFGADLFFPRVSFTCVRYVVCNALEQLGNIAFDSVRTSFVFAVMSFRVYYLHLSSFASL